MQGQNRPTKKHFKSDFGFIISIIAVSLGMGGLLLPAPSAYEYGQGNFFLVMLLCLPLVALPFLFIEIKLGEKTGLSLPAALKTEAGRAGEFGGWLAVLNSTMLLAMMVCLLSLSIGMYSGVWSELWQEFLPTPALAPYINQAPNPQAFFYNLATSWNPLYIAGIIWTIAAAAIFAGHRLTEFISTYIVPVLLFFTLMIFIAVSLMPHSLSGMQAVFTPTMDTLANPGLWRHALALSLLGLSLGTGIIPAFASHRKSQGKVLGISIFAASLKYIFMLLIMLIFFGMISSTATNTQSGNLLTTFISLPEAISKLLTAHTTSAIIYLSFLSIVSIPAILALLENLAASFQDSFGTSRIKTAVFILIAGFISSCALLLPTVIDYRFSHSGTLGLSITTLLEHWAPFYGILGVALIQSVVLGWLMGKDKLKILIGNKHPRLASILLLQLRFLIPLLIAGVLGWSVFSETNTGLYGGDINFDKFSALPLAVFIFWLVFTVGGASLLVLLPKEQEAQK